MAGRVCCCTRADAPVPLTIRSNTCLSSLTKTVRPVSPLFPDYLFRSHIAVEADLVFCPNYAEIDASGSLGARKQTCKSGAAHISATYRFTNGRLSGLLLIVNITMPDASGPKNFNVF
jgi:hypothetical protein